MRVAAWTLLQAVAISGGRRRYGRNTNPSVATLRSQDRARNSSNHVGPFHLSHHQDCH
jgi:hypothetical protein